jgi:GWxTD domain-containing protein
MLKKYFITSVTGFLLMALFAADGLSQRSDYQRLVFQNNQPNIYVDVISLPGSSENTVQLTTIFRLNNNFLPFKKTSGNDGKDGYLGAASLNIEVFKSPKKGLKPTKQVDVEGLESIGRASWQDTAFVESYEQTQSKSLSLSGGMQVEVKPGHYTYLLNLKRTAGNKGQNSQTRNIHLKPYSSQQNGDILLIKNVDDAASPSQLELSNRGDNITYGEDFYAFIHMPDFNQNEQYSVNVNQIKVTDEDTSMVKSMTEIDINQDDIIRNIEPKLVSNAQSISLKLNKNGTHNYALVKIPNKSFPNAAYRIAVHNQGNESVVARRTFQSYWADIPASLLSLDVAIDMLRFIADDETIDKIDDGSDASRERKFRAFWKDKDPTPQTEFNELQAEYYSRIDYAYENFGSKGQPGFETDRGQVYINFGKPNNTERTFPTDGATTEVWTYNNRKFVFKATSGFGDFRLVSQN